jgi:hypothetical protein
VYPAAALRAWHLPERGYKGGAAEAGRTRTEIFDGLAVGCDSWLDVSTVRSECINSDHTLDALISALNAVAAVADHTHRPESIEDHHCAVLEGWIHVPSVPLEQVVPPAPPGDDATGTG